MKNKNGSALLLYSNFLRYFFLLCCLAFTETFQRCCQTLQNGTCIQCPPGMHIFMNNCIFDLPNCLRYAGGFYCIQCSSAFNLTNDNRCVPSMEINISTFPSTNYSKLSKNILFNNANVQQIMSYLSNSINIGFRQIPDYILAAYYQKVSAPREFQLFRFIFQTKTGFLDIFLYYIQANKLIHIINQTEYMINNQSNSYVYLYYNIQKDPIYPLIQLQLSFNDQFRGLPVNNFTLIDSYKVNNPQINQYKLYYINQNVGLVQVKFQLSIDESSSSNNMNNGTGSNNSTGSKNISSNNTNNSSNQTNKTDTTDSNGGSSSSNNNSKQTPIQIPNFVDRQIALQNIQQQQQFKVGIMIAQDSYGSTLTPVKLFIRSFLNSSSMAAANITLDPSQTIYGIDFQQQKNTNLSINQTNSQSFSNNSGGPTDNNVSHNGIVKSYQFLYTIKRDTGDFIILSWKQISLTTNNTTNSSSNITSPTEKKNHTTDLSTNQSHSQNLNQTQLNVYTQKTVNFTTISLEDYQKHPYYTSLQKFLQIQRPVATSQNVTLIQIDLVDVWVNETLDAFNANTSFYLNNNNSRLSLPKSATLFMLFRLTYSLAMLQPYQIKLAYNKNSSKIQIVSQIGQLAPSNPKNNTNTSTNLNSNPSVVIDSTKFTQDQLIMRITSLLMAIYPDLLFPTQLTNVSYVQYQNDFIPPVLKDPKIREIQAKNTFPSTYRVYTLVFVQKTNKDIGYTFQIEYKNNQISFLKIPLDATPKSDNSGQNSSSNATKNQTNGSQKSVNNMTTNNNTETNSSTTNPIPGTSNSSKNESSSTNSSSNSSVIITNSSQQPIPQDQYIIDRTIIKINKLLKGLYSDIKNLQLQYVTLQLTTVGKIYQLWYQNDLNVFGYRIGVNVQGVVSLYRIYREQNIGQINAKVAANNILAATDNVPSSLIPVANNTYPQTNQNATKPVLPNNQNTSNSNSSNQNKQNSTIPNKTLPKVTHEISLLNNAQFKAQPYYNKILLFLSVIDDSLSSRYVEKVYKNSTLSEEITPNDKNITYLIYFANSNGQQKILQMNKIYELMIQSATNQVLIISINQDKQKLYQTAISSIEPNISDSPVLKNSLNTSNSNSLTVEKQTSQNNNTNNRSQLFNKISSPQEVGANNSNIGNIGGAILIVDADQNKTIHQENKYYNKQTKAQNDSNISAEGQIRIEYTKIIMQNKDIIAKEKSIIIQYFNYFSSQTKNASSSSNGSILKQPMIRLLTWEDVQHRKQYQNLGTFMHKLKSMVMCSFLYIYQVERTKASNQPNTFLNNSNKSLYQNLVYFGVCSQPRDVSHPRIVYQIAFDKQSGLYLLRSITDFDSLASKSVSGQNHYSSNVSQSTNSPTNKNEILPSQTNIKTMEKDNKTYAFCQQFRTVYNLHKNATKKDSLNGSNLNQSSTSKNQQPFNISTLYSLFAQIQTNNSIFTNAYSESQSAHIVQSTQKDTTPNIKGTTFSAPSLRKQTQQTISDSQMHLNQNHQPWAFVILLVKSKNIGQQNIFLTYSLNKTEEKQQTLGITQIHQIRTGEFIVESNLVLDQRAKQTFCVDTVDQNYKQTMIHNYFAENMKTYKNLLKVQNKIFLPVDLALKNMYYLASQQYAMFYYQALLRDAQLFQVYFEPISPQDNISQNTTNLQTYLNINALKLVFNSIYLVMNQSTTTSNIKANPSVLAQVYMITTAYNQSTKRFDVKAIIHLQSIQISQNMSSDQNCLTFDQNKVSTCLKCKEGYGIDDLNQIYQNEKDLTIKQFVSSKCFKTVQECAYQVWQICLICRQGYALLPDFRTCQKKT